MVSCAARVKDSTDSSWPLMASTRPAGLGDQVLLVVVEVALGILRAADDLVDERGLLAKFVLETRNHRVV
jgi:hypothetical protein